MDVLDAKSMAPMAGLVASPRKPLPTPFTNPWRPSFSAPSSGCLANPPIPLAILDAKALPPDVTPYRACFGRLRDFDMRRWS
jgi:hypothetical protein